MDWLLGNYKEHDKEFKKIRTKSGQEKSDAKQKSPAQKNAFCALTVSFYSGSCSVTFIFIMLYCVTCQATGTIYL